MNTQYILANLRKARTVIEATPENKLDLCSFKRESPCGTLACAAGWLAMSPAFDKLMTLTPKDPEATTHRHLLVPAGDIVVRYNAKGGYDFDWLEPHFGPAAFSHLFEARGVGYRDGNHPNAEEQEGEQEWEFPGVSDKDLALWRIDQQIEFVMAQGEAA